jgi:hypothetical protein
MVSMPVQNSAAWANHRMAKEIQPSASSPRKVGSMSAALAGMNFRKMMFSDSAAR